MTTAKHALEARRRCHSQTLQGAERQLGRSAVIAHQAHIAPRSQGRLDTLAGIADHMGTGHGQIVAENHTLEAQLAAQDVLQPAPGEASRVLVNLRIDDMRRHHCIELVHQTLERLHVASADIIETALVERDGDMRVRLGPAVPGEVFAGSGHPRLMHAADESGRQRGGPLRITLESATANHRTALVVEIQYRREAQIQANRQHLGRHQPAAMLGEHLGIVVVGDGAHRRQTQKALAQTLYPATFLIHRQQQIRAQGTDTLA